MEGAAAETCVTPGQRLEHCDEYLSGPGTYSRGQHLYASVVGYRHVMHPDAATVRSSIAIFRFYSSPSHWKLICLLLNITGYSLLHLLSIN